MSSQLLIKHKLDIFEHLTPQHMKYLFVIYMALSFSGLLLAQSPPSTDIYVYELKEKKGKISITKGENVTKRDGYDNQPFFYRNDYLLYSSYRNGQTDIYAKDLYTGEEQAATNTPESEYSPHVIPGFDTFAAVRQDKDGRQRLWLYHLNGKTKPELILEKIEPVGYFAYNKHNDVLAFVLGQPITLVSANAMKVFDNIVTSNVGRTIKVIPGTDDFAFERTEEDGSVIIYNYAVSSGEFQKIVTKPANANDWCITQEGTFITSVDTKLLAYNPKHHSDWQEIEELGEFAKKGISRMAVNQDNKRIAIVINN